MELPLVQEKIRVISAVRNSKVAIRDLVFIGEEKEPNFESKVDRALNYLQIIKRKTIFKGMNCEDRAFQRYRTTSNASHRRM